jgi:hypothetical protein
MSLAVIGNNLFAATGNRGVFRTSNNGASWTAVDSSLRYFGSLAVSGGAIFAAAGNDGVYISTNNGTDWTTSVDSDLRDIRNANVYSLAVSSGTIFAGTDSGAFISIDKGKNWTAVNYGFTYTKVYSLAVIDGNILAGTDNGVWRRPLAEIMAATDAHPQRFILNQAHFEISPLGRCGTTLAVAFTLPHPDQVTVKMYDMTGRRISAIVDKQLEAGSYRYLVDTHSFAQGCYAVRLQAGANTFMKTVRIVH